MLEGIRLVIYDLDGVLIDSDRAILESFRRTMEEIEEPYDPDKVVNRLGFSLYQIFQDLLPPSYHDSVEELRQIYVRHFQSLDLDYIQLLPDVAETLSEMKRRGLLQSLATNKTVTEAKRILEGLGVEEYFDLFAGFLTVDKPKPEPDMILYTLEKLNVDPFEAVLVDDTCVGLSAGLRAGVRTVGITTGNNTLEQIQSINPNVIINRMSDLVKIIA
jgi:HAD superfamily hydrolase (TIGR01509 family)